MDFYVLSTHGYTSGKYNEKRGCGEGTERERERERERQRQRQRDRERQRQRQRQRESVVSFDQRVRVVPLPAPMGETQRRLFDPTLNLNVNLAPRYLYYTGKAGDNKIPHLGVKLQIKTRVVSSLT